MADTPEFKLANEYLRTGDLIASGKRFAPHINEPSLHKFIFTRKMQETLKFVAQLREDGFIVSTSQIQMTLAAIASHDPASVYEADGATLKNIHEWDVRSRLAAETIESVVTMNGTVQKVKWFSRLKALESLAKMGGMFEQDNKQKALKVRVALG